MPVASLQLLLEFLNLGAQFEDGVCQDLYLLLVVVSAVGVASAYCGNAGVVVGVWGDAVLREDFRGDASALGEYAELFRDVAQLAYVARPFVGADHFLCLGCEAYGFGDVVACGGVERELLEEEHGIALPLAQGRYLDVDGAEAVVEVLAEASLLDGVGYVHVGGCHDADVCPSRRAAAHAEVLSRLEDAEQAGLRAHGQFAHLVKEECAAVGSSEVAFVLAYGTGEGTLLVSEELAVDGSLGDGAAVDGDVCLAAAFAVVVYDARYDFLAHAALALHEHGEVGGGYQDGCGKCFAKGLVASHDAVAVHQALHVRTGSLHSFSVLLLL